MHQSGRPTTEQRCCTAEQAAGVAGDSGGCSAAVGHKEGLRGGLQGPIKEEAGGLGVLAPVGVAAMIRVGEADRATALRDSGLGKEASGRRACGRTNLNYTGSSTRVHFRGLQRASNGIIPWPVG
jgi:hypothetical protein